MTRQPPNKAPSSDGVPWNRGQRRVGLKVGLRPDQRDALDTFAARQGISRARAISEAVDHYLKEFNP